MSAPKLLDRLRAKQAELFAPEVVALEYSEPARLRSTDAAKADSSSTPNASDSDRQTERIHRMAAEITPDELLSASTRIKPTLQKSLSETDLHELALTLAHADKREESLTIGATRPAREFNPANELKP
jgi:hypothetical protein